MAAYAAVVSLMHIIDDIENHPSPPISLDKQQVEYLTEKLALLQEFLESYKSPFAYSDEADPLEMHIADAAHAAEDVIESYIIDNIHLPAAATDDNDDDGDGDDATHELAATTEDDDDANGDDDADGDGDAATHAATTDDGSDEQINCIHFYQDLQTVIEEMDLIKKEVTEITREKGQQQRIGASDADLRPNSTEKSSLMVGFDDVLLQLLDRLTWGDANRQIIPIVGMGGIGKTTLAKGAFEHPLIKEHFDICVWATISQDYNIGETLREVLSQTKQDLTNKSEKDLGEILHKYLAGRRYLVIMDDIWSVEVWDKVKFFFPDYKNGSRIIVTTRMSNLAAHLTDSNSLLNMRFLDEVSCWNLFSKTVFGEESFPTQLEKIGKKNCGEV